MGYVMPRKHHSVLASRRSQLPSGVFFRDADLRPLFCDSFRCLRACDEVSLIALTVRAPWYRHS